MKKLSLVIAASFSLLSFNALAGGNCLYGHEKSLADAVDDVELTEKVDPTLLALLKKQQTNKEQVKPIITFN